MLPTPRSALDPQTQMARAAKATPAG
jgi:hypothetical protein